MASSTNSYNINLDDRVDKEPIRSPSRGVRALVYRGTMRPTGKKVAIKIFLSSPPTEQCKKSVLKGIEKWSKLHHINIVPVCGVVTKFDFKLSLISEWMDVGNAIDYVRKHAVDPHPLLKDVANGLRYLHGQSPPITHGDLRGKNVLISHDGRALLADYGVASLVDAHLNGSAGSYDPSWIRWMAPETMKHSSEPNTELDIWAFGMTALELFTRRPPFYNIPGIQDVISRIEAGPPDRPSEQVTHGYLTNVWWDICRSSWGHVPSQRPSMREILTRLE
ncbi:kinase-like domain-containing protein [Scleroderma yunnanense]